MSLRAFKREAEYRNAVSTAVAGSVLLHLLIITFGGSLLFGMRNLTDQQILGYRGPTRVVKEIDLIEPNSVQSYFHQRKREGRRRSPEYRLVERFELDSGPEPVPVRQPEKRPNPEPTPRVEEFDLAEPVVPVHREIAFSQDLVILHRVEPEYPEYERSQGIQGTVAVTFYVTPDGEVDAEQVIESRTKPPGRSPRAFELAALEAVKKWRIQPPLRDGEPYGFWQKVEVEFELR